MNDAAPSDRPGSRTGDGGVQAEGDAVHASTPAEAALPANYSHDLRASLAIVNGFSQALRNSFDDLQAQMLKVVDKESPDLSADAIEKLVLLESDCRFCLSRLQCAMQRLRTTLQQGQLLDDDAPSVERCA